MLPFKTVSVVLCDDIRTEQNNKFILIGVYNGAVVVSGFPAELMTSWWIQIHPEKIGKFDLDVQVIKDDGAVVFRAFIGFEIRELAWSVIPIPRAPLHLQSAGKFKFQMKLKTEGEWSTLQEFDVIVGNVVGNVMQQIRQTN